MFIGLDFFCVHIFLSLCCFSLTFFNHLCFFLSILSTIFPSSRWLLFLLFFFYRRRDDRTVKKKKKRIDISTVTFHLVFFFLSLSTFLLSFRFTFFEKSWPSLAVGFLSFLTVLVLSLFSLFSFFLFYIFLDSFSFRVGFYSGFVFSFSITCSFSLPLSLLVFSRYFPTLSSFRVGSFSSLIIHVLIFLFLCFFLCPSLPLLHHSLFSFFPFVKKKHPTSPPIDFSFSSQDSSLSFYFIPHSSLFCTFFFGLFLFSFVKNILRLPPDSSSSWQPLRCQPLFLFILTFFSFFTYF